MGETRHQTGAARARDVAAALAADGVSAVAGTYVDTAGIARVKAFPVERLEAAATQGIGMSPVFDAFLLDDSITRGRFSGGLMGDLRLFPDLDRGAAGRSQDGLGHRSTVTRRRASDTPTARAASPPGWPTDLPAQACRCALRSRSSGTSTPAPGTSSCLRRPHRRTALARIVELSDYCRDVLEPSPGRASRPAAPPEYAVGQFEVSVAHEDPGPRPTPACWCGRRSGLSARHGLRVSFAPSVVADGVGNGGHVHLSLGATVATSLGPAAPTADGADTATGLSPEGEAFAAGVLDELPGLLAIGAPSVASYLRLVPQRWAGAFRCWGVENRRLAVRVVLGQNPNIEVKCMDPVRTRTCSWAHCWPPDTTASTGRRSSPRRGRRRPCVAGRRGARTPRHRAAARQPRRCGGCVRGQ